MHFLNFLTYNIYLRPPLIGQYDYKDLRLQLFQQNDYFGRFDVLLLQEAFNSYSGRTKSLVDSLRGKGFNHVSYGPEKHLAKGFLVDSGLVVISKHAIEETIAEIFEPGIQSDRLARKGALYVRIRHSSGKRIHFFTTHTQASYEPHPPLNHPTVHKRLQQLMRVVAFVKRCLQDRHRGDEPVVLAGDFNVDALAPGNDEYKQMMRLFNDTSNQSDFGWTVRDVVFEQLREHPVTYTAWDAVIRSNQNMNSDTWAQRIDYIMLYEIGGGRASTSKVTDVSLQQFAIPDKSVPFSRLSDHFGLSGKLHFEADAD